ncbi:sugar-transfer associated ATP-grasp domain-containing protein [Flavobacterium sp. MK4S-17]|uniref:sugar-transfer associated ATP-grasp domain-containing protein n=1 Tax=Flavobacterium sp. MK4S-17 TaxID=2543737 RepID=UPI001357B03B|nr:sugar-transfer associated ATP-grasp domain-containing protein [Flavobacterium sp. MK4S-17]
MKRIIYLAYYMKELDKAKLKKFTSEVKRAKNISGFKLWKDVISSSLKYNISILDYFYFRFYELDSEQRKAYAGTGYMYEYQLKMNPPAHRNVLEDKILFLEKYKDFVIRKHSTYAALKTNKSLLEEFLSNPSGKLVAKGSKGQVGAEVKIIKTQDYTAESLLKYMKENNLDLLEDYVVQHPDIMAVSPSGLNTIRVFTQIENGKLYYLGARFRITINSAVDNMAAGNPAAPIDIETGKVNGPAIFSDITREGITVHPITGAQIVGFTIPFWEEIKEMLEKAVFLVPENRSIGWDIAITEKGPELIEGNHNWCKLLWQLPVRKGLKNELEKFAVNG